MVDVVKLFEIMREGTWHNVKRQRWNMFLHVRIYLFDDARVFPCISFGSWSFYARRFQDGRRSVVDPTKMEIQIKNYNEDEEERKVIQCERVYCVRGGRDASVCSLICVFEII